MLTCPFKPYRLIIIYLGVDQKMRISCDCHELLNYLIVNVIFRCNYENKPILLLSLIAKTWCEHHTWVSLICKYIFFLQ